MRPKEFRKYLDRDDGCVHCGEQEAVAPHHRMNRGMGGRKSLDRPANIIVLCSQMNGLVESDARYAALARANGWKLSHGSVPEETPAFYPLLGEWYTLDEVFGKKRVAPSEPPEASQ